MRVGPYIKTAALRNRKLVRSRETYGNRWRPNTLDENVGRILEAGVNRFEE